MDNDIRFTRAIVVGAIFTLIIAIVDPIRVTVSKGASLTSDYSAGASFFYFFIIILINGVISRFNKRFALSAGELIIIYGMMLVGCAIPTWGFTLNLIPLLPGIYYYADQTWENSVMPFVRKEITVSDGNAIQWFFEGLPPGTSIPWDKWLFPLLLWFILIMTVYLLSVLIMVLIRKRWIEEERLMYPLTIMPEKLSDREGNFPEIFRNKNFLAGVLIPLLILSIDCLHIYFPVIPSLQLRRIFFLFRKTTELYIGIYFEVIALMFFVPLDVSLGLWLFYLILFMTGGLCNIMGISFSSPEPWVMGGGLFSGYITMGAMLAMIVLMLWQERFFWSKTFKDKSNYPLIFTGIICFFIVVIWLTYAGLKFQYSIVFTCLAFLTFIGITRVVCQAGTPYARSGAVPAGMTLNIFGSKTIGPHGITTLGFTSPWACDLRTMVMTSIAGFIKLGHVFKINIRKIIIAGVIAVVLGLIGSAWSVINTAYRYGAINLGGFQFTSYVPYTMSWVKEYVLHPYGFGKYQFFAFFIGVCSFFLFWFMRIKFPAFPVHPIGLTIASTVPVIFTWFSIFLGWLFKFMILKYGGQRTYKNMQPFFLGMLLGTFFTAGMWMLIDFLTGVIPATHPILGS